MKRSLKFVLLLSTLMLGCCFAWMATAQATGEQSPEAVVSAAISALSEKNLEAYAAYVHPLAQERLRAMLWPMMEAAAANDTITSMTSLPKMLGLKAVDGKPEPVEASVFFLNLMKALTQVAPNATGALAGSRHTFLGQVPEGDSLMHCVIRLENEVNEKTASRVQLLTLRQSRDGWKLELSSELETAASRLGQIMRRATAAKATPEGE